MSIVNFNKEKFELLKKRYLTACENSEETFVFDGEEYLTKFAQYVIQYLADKFERKRNG